MKILFLTPQLPWPPRQGTAMRNWGLLSGVAKNHEVWLMSFDASGSASAELPREVREACARVATFAIPRRATSRRLRTLATSSLPDMAWRLWTPEFKAALDEWLAAENFDIVQVEGIELARYALDAKIESAKPKIIFDDHNCEYLLQQRAYETDRRNPRRWHAAAYSFVQARRLRAFERAACARADAVLCVSPQDADNIARLDTRVRPHVVFNGIDVLSYSRAANDRSRPPGPPSLVFTGKMDFRPNIDAMLWFAREVLPRVKKAVPTARLLIVGQKPHARLDALRADPNITITGEVDDVRPHIARADVYIAPLRVGGGTRFKLLEAMALHKAIVTTSLGCEGFDLMHGRDALIADTAEDFAGAVVSALKDAGLRARLGDFAYAFVRSTYDWRAIVPKLEDVYAQLAAAPSARA